MRGEQHAAVGQLQAQVGAHGGESYGGIRAKRDLVHFEVRHGGPSRM
jgi:hypothetical protein